MVRITNDFASSNRKIELFATVDNVHYIKDKNYYSKFDYFQGDNIYV
jgi:hypothetical protein